MAGHSKWAQIKRKKAVADTKKGKIYGKLSQSIQLSARKDSNPDTNFELRSLIEEAKSENMPTSTIERAIKKGSGDGDSGGVIWGLLYEAYGPGGVALLIRAVTDNRNRTVAEVKHILSKHGGRMVQEGSVRWMFLELGVLRFLASKYEREKLEELALEKEVEDIINDEQGMVIFTKANNLGQILKEFSKEGFIPESAKLEYIAHNEISLNPESEDKLQNLIEDLFEQDDVHDIFLNTI